MLIESVQRRATAMIKKCNGLSYEERLRILGIPTLEYKRHRADLIQVYRLFSGIDRMDANVFFYYIMKTKQDLLGLKLGDITEN